eukprot:m.108669 g.108669  ORF g.108669 m.108669 type:complete len:541 (+) comp37321_c0_seq15:357-1979(+)
MALTSKCRKIVQEIHDTEATYIGHLQLIIQLFLNPTREACLLPDHARAAIFSNVEAILAVNSELLACMQLQSPGDAFLRLAPFLRLYSLYANNFQRANQMLITAYQFQANCLALLSWSTWLRMTASAGCLVYLVAHLWVFVDCLPIPPFTVFEYPASRHSQSVVQLTSKDMQISNPQEWTKKSPEFARFRRLQEAQPECCGLALPSLLIMPVQRVPRCKLLLDDLLKHTPIDDPERDKLKAACHQIGQVTSHINEHIRTHENFRHMLRIQNSMSGVGGILAPGRKFIREGRLMKVCKRKSKERMCFLFSDLFIYARPNLLDSVESGTTYTCRSVFPLMFCTVVTVRVDEEADVRALGASCFIKIHCKDSVVLMFGKSIEEIQSWVDSLNHVIEELRNQQISLLEQIKERANRDRCHKLRDRISRHLDASMEKIVRLSRSFSTSSTSHADEMTPLLSSKSGKKDANEVDQAALLLPEELPEDNIEAIREEEENNDGKKELAGLLHNSMPEPCDWRCSPWKLKTTTYDVQKQKISSRICVIL